MIVINKAEYGFNADKIDVTGQVINLLMSNNNEITASNEIAGDPCFGQPKNLRINFSEDGKDSEISIKEGESFTFLKKIQKPLEIFGECRSKQDIHKWQPIEKLLTIIIPCREGEGQELTLKSLGAQTFQGFTIVVSNDEGKGANFARNKGFSQCKTPYVLFSDNDLEWEPNSIESMLAFLMSNPYASYVYGWYLRGEKICSREPFNVELLKKKNFINTMAIIRTKDFPGFDEKIKRLQDWDLWLNMLSKNKKGVFLDKQIFKTVGDNGRGITFGNKLSYDAAVKIVKEKYKR